MRYAAYSSRGRPRRRGLFITFEGVDGSGKSTQIRLLAARLRLGGAYPLVTREPGGTPLAEALRAALLAPSAAGTPPLAELLLVAAARVDHIERVIAPALRQGRVVLCDRFLDATRAYQGYGRRVPQRVIDAVHAHGPLTLRPDLTLLFELPPAAGRARAGRRNASARGAGGRQVRFDLEPVAFHQRVAAGYRRLARREPERIRLVDASGSPDEVAVRVDEALSTLLARGPARSKKGR